MTTASPWDELRCRVVKPPFRCWTSEQTTDERWDAFLLESPLGQFQQSSAWSRVKHLEGWRCSRFLVTGADGLEGGFQVLWKARRGLRFGYVSKGPVIAMQGESIPVDLPALLKAAARRLGLTALIVQPPDLAVGADAELESAGFLENQVEEVYSATVLLDLTRPLPEIERGFSHDVARQVRKLRKGGTTTRLGSSADAERFFELMLQTCERQKVAPNPSTAALVRAIVEEFEPLRGRTDDPIARILFADLGGRAIGGFLIIRFGGCLTLWKKGTAHDVGRTQPNRLLEVETIRLAHALGCTRYDNFGIERRSAEALLAGLPRSEIAMKPSDVYKFDFGGIPVLLPPARIWLPSHAARVIYRAGLPVLRRRPGG